MVKFIENVQRYMNKKFSKTKKETSTKICNEINPPKSILRTSENINTTEICISQEAKKDHLVNIDQAKPNKQPEQIIIDLNNLQNSSGNFKFFKEECVIEVHIVEKHIPGCKHKRVSSSRSGQNTDGLGKLVYPYEDEIDDLSHSNRQIILKRKASRKISSEEFIFKTSSTNLLSKYPGEHYFPQEHSKLSFQEECEKILDKISNNTTMPGVESPGISTFSPEAKCSFHEEWEKILQQISNIHTGVATTWPKQKLPFYQSLDEYSARFGQYGCGFIHKGVKLTTSEMDLYSLDSVLQS